MLVPSQLTSDYGECKYRHDKSVHGTHMSSGVAVIDTKS